LMDFLNKEKLTPQFEVFTTAGTDPIVNVGGRDVLMFSSNNYLGLATHPRVIEGAKMQLKKHGGGPGGSRFLCGNIDILDDLDKKVAATVGAEDAITFPTGYMANLAIFNTLMDPLLGALPYSKNSGVIFSDEYNHATVVDGCRLSSAKKIVFKHNDMADLESKLKKFSKNKHKMIITEGVFSLDGHLGKLKEIADLSKKYNCIFMVDDAHGIGVVGEKGGGVPQLLKITKDVDIFMGSFDKALGCMGGYLAGKKELIEYLRIASRPYIFSSAVPGVLAGGAIAALDICCDQKGAILRRNLMKNSNYVGTKLKKLGYNVLGDGTVFALPVIIGDEDKAIQFSTRLFEEGIFIPSFRWPAVPKGTARVRVTPMATHQKKHLDYLVDVFYKVGKELSII